MFDSLNKRFLPPYGCDWVHAPNFKRLSENTVIFDNCYAGSLPCMPARRELHTGRYNFLHRSWGPLEPFDDSMPEILKKNGIYTHLVSDHYHYWEDGGMTYHNRYNTYELVRGHEGDLWKGEVKDPTIPPHVKTMREGGPSWRQDWVNRKYMSGEEDQPLARTFKKGLEFIKTNYKEDDWFLQIETFDPHEPFFTQEKYKNLYKHDYSGPHFDWPNYSVVTETPEQVKHCRLEYAASVSMCDNYLGKILDIMDEKEMWNDTMLLINVDHGFLLGEKDWWGKAIQPIYNEIAQIPFFIWDPRLNIRDERRKALVQTIDIAPTILEFFNIKRPKTMEGKVLKNTIESDVEVRDAALFGYHGSSVNVTDGKYVYMRAPAKPENSPIYDYTLIPTDMRNFFSNNELRNIELAEPFEFTKNCKTMKINPIDNAIRFSYLYGSILFDLDADPTQEKPIEDPKIEKIMIKYLIDLMKKNDSPKEQYERLNIPSDGSISDKHLSLGEVRKGLKDTIGETEIFWKNKGKSAFSLIMNYTPKKLLKPLLKSIEKRINEEKLSDIDEQFIFEFMDKLWPKQYRFYLDFMKVLIKEKAL
jgi:arylsulfatase A-like enzyme